MPTRSFVAALAAPFLLIGSLLSLEPARAAEAPAAAATGDRFAPYEPRNGHVRPLVAVVAGNAGTELTDFVVPFALLHRSGAADVLAVSTQLGPIAMRPALRLHADTDLAGFDSWYPEGADYVVVPAMAKPDEPRLLAWIRAQYAKGATILSICDGALVVANTGLLEGHRATAHWATEGQRRETWPGTTWVKNARYVVDGRLASSAGISAAIPASLALVEAIGGRARARQVGAGIGVSGWSTAHDSKAFGITPGNLWPLLQLNATNRWLHRSERFEMVMRPGLDDLALALTADAWSRTGRSSVHGVAATPEVQSDSGLLWFADTPAAPGMAEHLDAAGTGTDTRTDTGTPVFDTLLAAIARRYGRATALGVALDFEYPWRP